MTSGPVFVTGGTGFVGRVVLERLRAAGAVDVRCLCRDVAGLAAAGALPADWSVIAGDLLAPESWTDFLPAGGTVLHLAAVTGKARARRHRAVNAEATRVLIARAREAGVERFIFVSSIAATFPDTRHYPYASAKAAAEDAVRTSGLDWAIVRPTQVFGPGSPVLAGLRALAGGPIGIRFGRGTVRMQPVHVADLADALVALLERPRLGGVTVEIGGPDIVSVAQLLRTIRRIRRDSIGPWLTIPLWPVRPLLGLVEPWLLPLLPLTAGQLASFVEDNDGTARAGAFEFGPAPTHDLEAMLAEPTPP